MKKIWILLFVLLISVNVNAQENKPPKLSPITRQYLQKVKQSGDGGYVPGYVYKTIGGRQYMSGMIKVRDASVETAMKKMGVKIGTKAGNIWTVQVPVSQVRNFTSLIGIDYIQLDEPAIRSLDSARRATHADSVHGAVGMWMPYTGKDVVVGIVDAGFDYGHPVLFDTSGSKYRVKKVWEEKTTGTPPSGFSYGNEITDSAAMWAKGTDDGQTHGTHVAGIAAGSGYGSSADNKRFRGMAYQSDIVLVGITPDQSQWVSTGVSDMVDGINYVYQYAASVSKPAVVNLSWGSPLGPRDGTSLFNQAVDNLTGKGKIFVCSAGNNGQDNIHVQKKFTATDTIVSTFLALPTTPIGKRSWVDIWGDTAKSFCVRVMLFNRGTAIDSTAFFCLDDAIHQTHMIGSNGDTCFVDFTTSSSEFNDKPRVFLDCFSKAADTDAICISIKGTSGTINMWQSYVYNTTGYYGSFNNNGLGSAVSGNTDMTMSDLAVTKSAITVGAYASKTSFVNISGGSLNYNSYATKGGLAPFSSRGPSVDSRKMPYITGPGLTVGSALSSYDTTFAAAGSEYNYVINKFTNPRTGRDYPFGMLSGTSMSSPAVAGIVAMMLEANNALDPNGVKDIIRQTAITDNFTHPLPQPDNKWGWGKINAYGAVKRAFETSSIHDKTHTLTGCTLFPNPSNGRFIIDYMASSAQVLTVNIYSITGALVASEKWPVERGENAKDFNFAYLQKGIYLTKIGSKDIEVTIKTIVQ
ncbi:MAG: S8/S53 family peptidase [Flavipsychrobacter sp.]